jgi:hypothetical protein
VTERSTPVDESAAPVVMEAKVAVYYDAGSLEAKAHYVTEPGYLAVLTVAAKVLDYLGDEWHAAGDDLVDPGPGPGGVVRVGAVELTVSPADVMICVAMDGQLHPVHDQYLGQTPKPVHFWTGAFLLRALARHAMTQSLLAHDAEMMMRQQLATQMKGGSAALPDELRRRLQ